MLCYLVLLLQIVTNILDKLLKISDNNNAVELFFSSPFPFRKSTFQVLLNTCSGAQNGWVPFGFSSIMDVEFHSDSQLHPSLFAEPCYQHRAHLQTSSSHLCYICGHFISGVKSWDFVVIFSVTNFNDPDKESRQKTALTVSKFENFDPFFPVKFDSLILKTHFISL